MFFELMVPNLDKINVEVAGVDNIGIQLPENTVYNVESLNS